jgi:biopolymer transport protein ExbB/TolQ
MDRIDSRAVRPRIGSPASIRLTGLAIIFVGFAAGAADENGSGWEVVGRLAERLGQDALAWYGRTPATERVTWGALASCVILGTAVTLGRSLRLRRGRVVPQAFAERFLRRLSEGQLDRGKALDYCELNPSPAARVALAAVHRWGRSTADLERGAALARRRELDGLRRHVGTLRRIAALAPLIGLLGTLTAAGRALALLPPGAALGPAVAEALGPLTVGVAVAILALVFYDGLMGRVEVLASELDRILAEIVDAIASSAIPETAIRHAPVPAPRAPHAAFIASPRIRDEP